MQVKTRLLFLLLIVLTAWTGLSLQFILTISRLTSEGNTIIYGLLIYFGYLTTLTNFFVAIITTTYLLSPSSQIGRNFAKPSIFGSAASTIFFGGLAYHFLLSDLRTLEGLPNLVNLIQHYYIPIGFVLYWFVYPPKQKTTIFTPIVWSIFPVIYIIYVFILGRIIDVYPYPMLNVIELGYSQSLINAFMLLLLYLVAAYIFFAATKTISKYRIVVNNA